MLALPGNTPTLRAAAPKLRESCRAVRAALLASTAAAAFAAAAPAVAGSCVLTGNVMACDGTFATPAPDSPLAFVGDDLTIVVGGETASSVTATGVDGISLSAPTAGAGVVNYADVSAIGISGANAVEIDALGDVHFDNFGDASASLGSGGSAPYDVTAVDLYSAAGSVFASNAAGGTIEAGAAADYGYTLVRGVVSLGENSYFDNFGGIEVQGEVEVGNLVAIGIQQTGGGFATVVNELGADISVSGDSGHGISYGADSFAAGSFITGTSAYLRNDGGMTVESAVHGGEGIATAIGNESYGVFGFATTTNYGSISAHAQDDSSEASYSFAYGVIDKDFALQSVASANNFGTIDAHAETYFGAAISYGVVNWALYSETLNGEGALVRVQSEVEYAGMASAVGSKNYGKYYAHAVNDGTISAEASSAYTEHDGRFTYAAANAIGVIEEAPYLGGVVLENSGVITATATTRDVAGFFQGGASATGVHQNGKYYAGTVNTGDIVAYAETNSGIAGAFGVEMRSKYGATTYVYNGGEARIVAEAHSGSQAGNVQGGLAFANGVRMFAGSYALVYNDGLVAGSATVDANDRDYLDPTAAAQSYGVYQRGEYGATLRNAGDIVATAEADFGYASAYGDWMRGFYYAVSYNENRIAAIALADDGNAFAVANYVDSPGQAVYQYCIPDGGGCVYSYYGGQSALENDGLVQAYARADRGVSAAYGGVVIGALHAQAANRGDILAVAEAEGGSARAVGLLLRSDAGDAWLDNAEGASIVAVAHGDEASATAVLLVSPLATQLGNHGVLAAVGDGERVAIDARLTGGVSIDNHGLAAGSILGSAYDDWLYNAQGAELRLSGSTIDLGYFHAYGNHFENHGLVSIDGENSLSMGSVPQGLLPSANPDAFYNDGLLDFADGDTGDALLVVGDFAGKGELAVDVDGLDHDTLTIDGSVLAGTAQSIDASLHGLTNGIEGEIALVYVTGNSEEGQFTLGDVAWDEANSFVTLDFDIVHGKGSGGDPDVFALGVSVSGLSDAGIVLADLPGAVQGLANAQVGTWRQRTGALDHFSDHAVALWARLWNEKGGFAPAHAAGNFGDGGRFNWQQKAAGMESGVDFAFNEQASLGLLLGQAKADTHLGDLRKGRSGIAADTWGLYGTWITPTGFYLDASYRWMRFDVDVDSKAGARELDGDAETLNVELGHAWTLPGGLEIEPQLQYTHTRVEALGVVESDTGMAFASEGGDSRRGRAGIALRKHVGDAAAGWNWNPYATLSAVREFDGGNRYSVNGVLDGEVDLSGTSALLDLGLSARHGDWNFQGGLHWQDGGAAENFLGAQFSLRYTFGPAR